MFALIFENKVIQIEESSFPVTPALQWIECDESVMVGYFYLNGHFAETNKTDLEILAQEKIIKITQCRAYLSSTDWQVIRVADPSSGEALKEGVAENRMLARSLQDDIAACTTLKELNAININFE